MKQILPSPIDSSAEESMMSLIFSKTLCNTSFSRQNGRQTSSRWLVEKVIPKHLDFRITRNPFLYDRTTSNWKDIVQLRGLVFASAMFKVFLARITHLNIGGKALTSFSSFAAPEDDTSFEQDSLESVWQSILDVSFHLESGLLRAALILISSSITWCKVLSYSESRARKCHTFILIPRRKLHHAVLLILVSNTAYWRLREIGSRWRKQLQARSGFLFSWWRRLLFFFILSVLESTWVWPNVVESAW